MRRPRLFAATGGLAALVAVSLWVFTAEARGALPEGDFTPAAQPVWPLSEAAAQSLRNDALTRAALRVAHPEIVSISSVPKPDLPPDDPLTCRYLHDAPSGTTAKFNCVLAGGVVIKVKYNRNS